MLQLVCWGHSHAQIAHLLVLSECTVKAHVSHVLAKVACRSGSQAAALARQRGLGNPTDHSCT